MEEVAAPHGAAIGSTGLHHADCFELGQDLSHFFRREGAYETELHKADLEALTAQVLDGMPGRQTVSSLNEENEIRVFRAKLLQEGEVVPAEDPVVVSNDLPDYFGHVQKRLGPLQVHDDSLIGTDLRPVGDRFLRVQDMGRFVRRE